MESKTIALLLPDLRAGGAERVAITLMKSFRRAGHRVEFVLMEKKGELLAEIPRDVRIVDLGAARVRHAIRPLVRYLKQSRPDAMQASMWPLTIAAILARWIARSRARLVVSDHAALTKQFAGHPVTLAAIAATVRFFYPLADSRVMVAKAAADDLAHLSGLSGKCFDIIYNPVEPPAVDLLSTPEIDALWGDADGRIISVGTLKAQKNHQLLIRSFARLRKRRAARLIILGSGELEAELRHLAASLGVADDVIFPGFSANPWPYYASADLFVLSSDYEGYPLVMIEAMRCGLPIVSTDCESGPSEILDRGRFGKLVPVGREAALAEAMEEALAEPHSADLIRSRAEELSGANTAQRYLDLLLANG